jgi:hypothetical protein
MVKNRENFQKYWFFSKNEACYKINVKRGNAVNRNLQVIKLLEICDFN